MAGLGASVGFIGFLVISPYELCEPLVLTASDDDKTQQVLRVLDKSIAANPDDIDALELRYLFHYKLGMYAEAESDARAMAKTDPRPDPYMSLGEILRAQRKLTEAREAYKQAVARGPRRVTARYMLGVTHYELGEYNEAVEVLSDACRSKSWLTLREGLFAHYYLGRGLDELGESARAEKAYQELPRYRKVVDELKKQLAKAPDTSDFENLRANLADIESRLT